MKPILKYRGGKNREIKHFHQFIPEYDTYIEPFFGGGALYFHMEPKKAIINDVNDSLIHFYKDLTINFELVKQELNILQNEYETNREIFMNRKEKNPLERAEDPNEEIYYKIRDMFNNKIERKYSYATIYFYINKTAYSGMIRYNSKGEFNVPYGRYANFNTKLLTYDHYDLLKNSKISNTDYSKVFEIAKPNDFIFLDPPYDTTFSEYGNEVFTGDFDEDSQRKLAEDFKNLGSKTMIIISETPLISELYKDYIHSKYSKSYAVNIRNRFKSEANHLIITNYL